MKKSKVATALLATAMSAASVASASIAPAEAQYVSWSSKGRPSFYFDGNGAAYKDKTDVVLSKWYADKMTSSTDDCGYKRITKGKADSISSLQMGETTIAVASLPEFDGKCSAGVLVAPEGSTAPTSHYQRGGAVYAKVTQGTVIRVAYTNYPKSLTADKCGNYKLNWPKPIMLKADGTTYAFPTDSTVTVNGTSYNLDTMGQIIKCTTTYEPNSSTGVVEKVQRLFEIQAGT